jgi:hypothetical protein
MASGADFCFPVQGPRYCVKPPGSATSAPSRASTLLVRAKNGIECFEIRFFISE